MFVKICGLRSVEHVRAAVDAGADAVGFVFADSIRRIAPAAAAEIAKRVPDTVRRVAVMLHPSEEEWQQVLQGFGPDVLQTDAEDFARLDLPDDIERWPVYREGNAVSVTVSDTVSDTVTDTFVYEGAKSGRGVTVDWTHAAGVAARGGMILAGGLSAANVGEAIAAVRPYGVDVSSGVETAPGRKSQALIGEFIKAAKAAGKDL